MPQVNQSQEAVMTQERQLAQLIDHTKLTFAPDENEIEEIAKLCEQAITCGFYAVCVRPRHIAQAKELLNGTSVKVAAVIGFPIGKVQLEDELKQPSLGRYSTSQKEAETRFALDAGVDELDLVICIADLKEDVKQGSQKVRDELLAIRNAAQERPIKVIIETDLLTPEEIKTVTRFCAETGMGMVKTSTGMVEGGVGATVENVRLIRQTLSELGAKTGIKASGGIRNREQALLFAKEGINRIGTSAGVTILQNAVPNDKAGY